MKKDLIKYSAVIIIIILFLLFFWPTMYQYDKLNGKWPVRFNRITGSTEVLYMTGWEKITENKPLSQTVSDVPLTNDELSKIQGNLKIIPSRSGDFWLLDGDIYNGNDKDISDLTIQINVYKEDKTLDFLRKYKLSNTGNIHSLRSTIVSERLDFAFSKDRKWDYKIVSAKWSN